MNLALYIVAALIITYFILIALFLFGWTRSPAVSKCKLQSFPLVSVVIAVRNEQNNLEKLIPALLQQDYPNYEIIIVDDYSEDNTYEILCKWKDEINILQNDYPQGKKYALLKGIENAKGEIIISTDADCFVSTAWVSLFVCAFQNFGSDIVLGNVLFNYDSLYSLAALEALEFASLLASTAGSVGIGLPFMGNGANIAFRKQLWKQAKMNFKHPSGDDVFFIAASKKEKKKIFFLKNKLHSVITNPPDSLKSFFFQRLRWASKTSQYKDYFALFIAILVFSVNLSLLIILFLDLKWFLFFLFVKSSVDFILLKNYLSFYGKSNLLLWFAIEEILYIFYAVFIGLFSQFIGFEWKGIKYKK